MRDWIVKLTAIDGDAASVLRVIEHFDTLVDERVAASSLLRAVTVLADCGAGFDDSDRGLRIAVNERGRVTLADERPDRPCFEQFEGITVWLDRTGPPWPLDKLIMERFVRSLHAIKQPVDRDPKVAAIRVVCDPKSEPKERSSALTTLGLTGPVTIAATSPHDARRVPIGMTTDNVRIHLLPNRPSLAGVPPDIAAGFATASGLLVCTHWQRAVTALKIAADPTTGGPTHVSYDDLGAVAEVIDNIDATTAWSSPDVQLLEKLRQQRPWVTGLLDGILSHSSMREVARVQHLHHSTLQQRFDWLQNQIGYTVLSPSGYARASTALVLWRLARASKNKTKPVPSTMEDAEPPIGG